jgi:hypothetical protein
MRLEDCPLIEHPDDFVEGKQYSGTLLLKTLRKKRIAGTFSRMTICDCQACLASGKRTLLLIFRQSANHSVMIPWLDSSNWRKM